MLSPDVGHKQMRKWLLGYVDFIFHAEVAASGHQLRLRPTATIHAGGRVPRGVELPATIPLEADAWRGVLEKVA
jgi:hypothetical protein